LPREVFIAGQVLTADELNTVSDQTVMTFAGTAARGSAIPSPTEGMTSYLDDLNRIEVYTGNAWGPVGTILQVVSAIKTDTFTTSSTSFTAVTGLSASITPSSTASKVLVLVNLTWSMENGVGYGHFRLSGGNSGTYVGAAAGSRVQASFGGYVPSGNMSGVMIPGMISYLDSPASASSITYGVEARQAFNGAVTVNRSVADVDSALSSRNASSITLMEVAG
jgi:hypothetical protein